MQTIARPGFASLERPRTRSFATNFDSLCVCATVILGALLRWFSAAMKSDLWYDEVFSYNIAAQPFGSMTQILYAGADTNPPLYTMLLHFWLKLGTSDIHVKLFSLLFALASIPLVYLLARRMFGRHAALISSLLFATSPSVITYSVEARPYALFVFLSLLSTYCLTRTLQERVGFGLWTRKHLWLCYGLATTLCVYTHWFALLVVLTHAATFVIYGPRAKNDAWQYIFTLMVIIICCVPLAPFLWNQIALQSLVGGYRWPGTPGPRSIFNLAGFLTGDKNLLPVCAVILGISWLSFKRHLPRIGAEVKRHIVFLTSYLFIPLCVVLILSRILGSNSFFVNRYFLPFIVSVHLGVGLALSRLDRKLAFAFMLVFVAFPIGKTLKHWSTPETPYSQAASVLSVKSHPRELVAHLSPMSYWPVLHYLPSDGTTYVTEKILYNKAGTGYETTYNLRGGTLTADDLIEIGAASHRFERLCIVIDPMDRDRCLLEAYNHIRHGPDFVFESARRIGELRLEYYTSRNLLGDAIAADYGEEQ